MFADKGGAGIMRNIPSMRLTLAWPASVCRTGKFARNSSDCYEKAKCWPSELGWLKELSFGMSGIAGETSGMQ
jgi:hypothetical protein